MRKREESGELSSSNSYYQNSSEHDCTLENTKQNLCEISEKQDNISSHMNDGTFQYQFLIDNLLEGIVILDINSVLHYCNQTALHLLGYHSPSEIEGYKLTDFIMKDSLDVFDQDMKEVSLGRGRFLHPYKVRKKDGSIIWINGLGCMISYNENPATILFLRDVTTQQKTVDQLEKLEKKYRTIAELSVSGIITLNPLGEITYVNKAFERITQKQCNNLENTLFRELLKDEDVYMFQQLLMNVRKKKETIEHVELDLQGKSHQLNPIEISIAPVFEENTFTGYICTIHDIKERKKFESEIRKSERLKTEFMNIAAHELKSPVTPIKGYLDLIISDQQTDDRIKKWAMISLRNAERLLLLVDDILDVARLDNDSMKFEIQKIDISSLFYEIIEDMKPFIEQKNLTFNQDIAWDLPEILGDYHRLNQVLRNLFTNAIKFTDEGSISLRAYTKEDKVVFEVMDTGIGMREDEASKVFNKFYQTETSDNRKHEGTGLGLFICKEIIRKHHGDISVDSTLGEGSKFTVTLPAL